MGDSRETTVLDLGSVEGDGVFGELEPLLDERSEFADSSSLFAKNLLCMCGSNDDVGDCGTRESHQNLVTLNVADFRLTLL